MDIRNVRKPEEEAGEQSEILGDVGDILRTVRANLGMDVAFVGEFVGSRRIFRHIESEAASPFSAGEGTPLEESYCQRIVDGRLPQLIRDTSRVPETATLPVTAELPIGAHLSVPIRLSDGSLYGTFCCFSHEPAPSLDMGDLRMMRTFAELTARRIERTRKMDRSRTEKRERIVSVIASGKPSIVFQPIFDLEPMRPIGVEALARFSMEPRRPPDEWFAEAAEVGLQVDLELQAIRNALEAFAPLWAIPDLSLGVNASPETILDSRFHKTFAGLPTRRIVIELTEHDKVRDYAPLVAEFACMRAEGIRIAIDDVGAGYASLRHVLAIRPDIMKLDRDIVRDIHLDPMKLALATALMGFAGQVACRVVAEGVEKQAELDVLKRLGIPAAQGFLLGRPMPAEAIAGVVA
ncbi:sensor domain-containing phosphodiesterase [Aureimonas psammosilenae]|uniref:sensor domain-containing phosphodiesterase n=1 Tax=Aureimonas psammosilenae TaxID=2495496 RepID=UPI001869C7D1|nr:EAL domain-containing protein [Aureimonas psammosilenae]